MGGHRLYGDLIVDGISTFADDLMLGKTTTSGTVHEIRVQGTETNRGIDIITKGTGIVRVPTGYESNIGTDDRALVSRGYVLGVAKTFTTKQSFQASATNAGLNIVPVAGDPSSPANGDVWYNATTNKFRAYQNGAAVDIIGGGGTITGSGTAGRVVIWTGATAIADDGALLYNAADDILGVPRVNFTAQGSDPASTVANGDLTYNSASLDFRGRINGQWVNFTRPEQPTDIASGTYTLTEADRNKILYFTNAVTITGPNLSTGFTVTIVKAGSGDVLFDPDSGLTLSAVSDTIFTQFGAATFVKRSASVWYGFGALGTSGGGGGGGTVTTFSSGALSPIFTTSVANATTTPALSFSLSNQNANLVFAGPTTGAAAAPTFRSLVAADIPALPYLTGNQTITLTGPITGSGATSIATSIAADAVTYDKIQNAAALSVLGRASNTSGDLADITAASDGDVLTRSGNSIIFGSIDSKYWKTTGTSTLTGVATITSNANSQHIFNGTWTSTGTSQFHVSISPTITATSTVSDSITMAKFNPEIIAGANNQTLTTLDLTTTYTTGAFTPGQLVGILMNGPIHIIGGGITEAIKVSQNASGGQVGIRFYRGTTVIGAVEGAGTTASDPNAIIVRSLMTGGNIVFKTDNNIFAGGIDASQNFYIGQSFSPSAKLHIRPTTNNAIGLRIDADGGTRIFEVGESAGARYFLMEGVPQDDTKTKILALDSSTSQVYWRDSSTLGGGGSYTDEQAQDAVGSILINGNGTTSSYIDGTPSISYSWGGDLTGDVTITGSQTLSVYIGAAPGDEVSAFEVHAADSVIIDCLNGAIDLESSGDITVDTAGVLALIGDSDLNIIGSNGLSLILGSSIFSVAQGHFDFTCGTVGPAEIRLFEDSDNGTNYTAFKPGVQSANITYTLPTAAAAANGHVLSSTTAGVMSWAAPLTNTAANTELSMSDGTNLVPSGVFIPSAGNIDIGTGLTGSARTVSTTGTESNIQLILASKGTSPVTLLGNSVAFNVDANGGSIGGNLSVGTSGPNYRGLTYAMHLRTGNTTPSGAPIDGVFLYTKDVSASAELFAMNEAGVEIQLTGGSGGGISNLNTLTASTQTFAVGTSGADFNISSATSTHTFNIPDASASARGLVTTGAQTFTGDKTFSFAGTSITNIQTTTGTSTIGSSFINQLTTSNNMVDGFGPSFLFRIRDNAGVDNNIGRIAYIRDGADNSGALVIQTFTSGSANERLRITNGGFVGIGVTATRTFEVGGSAAVKAGNSTGVIARVGGVIHTNTTSAGNVGTGDDTIFTYAVPANTLNTNKDALVATAAGTFATSVNSKRLRVKFGATTIFDSGALAITTTADWVLEIEIIRTGAATQKCNVRLNTSSGSLSAYADYSTAAETLSGAVNLVISGEATDDNDIVGEMFKVRWESSE